MKQLAFITLLVALTFTWNLSTDGQELGGSSPASAETTDDSATEDATPAPLPVEQPAALPAADQELARKLREELDQPIEVMVEQARATARELIPAFAFDLNITRLNKRRQKMEKLHVARKKMLDEAQTSHERALTDLERQLAEIKQRFASNPKLCEATQLRVINRMASVIIKRKAQIKNHQDYMSGLKSQLATVDEAKDSLEVDRGLVAALEDVFHQPAVATKPNFTKDLGRLANVARMAREQESETTFTSVQEALKSLR